MTVHHGEVRVPRLQMNERALTAPDARRVFWLVGVVIAVPATAALITYSHTRVLGSAVIVFGSLIALAAAIERGRYPLHLMPVAAITAWLAWPVVGMALAGLIALAVDPIPLSVLANALLGSLLIAGASLVVMHRLRAELSVRLALVGSPSLAGALESDLVLARLPGYEVVGWIDVEPADGGLDPDHLPGPEDSDGSGPSRLGPVALVADIVSAYELDLIVFGVRESGLDRPEEGISALDALETVSGALLGTSARLIGANQFFEQAFGHVPLATMNAAWFQYVLHPRFRATSLFLKRMFDTVLAAITLLVTAPLFAVAAIAIKLDDGGPILYRQRRVGQAGRTIEMLKLRTMDPDAAADGLPVWTEAEDPRVTRAGRVLRWWHLDELPQLVNVLRGDMSLVGPRPEQPERARELELHVDWYDQRELMKPGVTGWAQVRVGYAGSDRGTGWKLAHDLYYLKHRSLALDAMILIETLATPIRDAGVTRRVTDEVFVGRAVHHR